MPQYNNRESSNKGLIITLFLVSFFAVAALGFLFYNVFTSNPAKNTTADTTNTLTPTTDSSTTVTTRPTATPKPSSSNNSDNSNSTNVTPTPSNNSSDDNNGSTNTVAGNAKAGDAGLISYLSNWEVVTDIPDAVKADLSDSPNANSKMFIDKCALMLKNKTSNSMMVLEVKPQGDDGVFCFSTGTFFGDTSRKITTTNFNRALTISKWALNQNSWKNDYIEGPFSLLNTGKNETVTFALYTTAANKEADEKDFDTMLDTWQYR